MKDLRLDYLSGDSLSIEENTRGVCHIATTLSRLPSKNKWGEKDYILREVTFDYVEGQQYIGRHELST